MVGPSIMDFTFWIVLISFLILPVGCAYEIGFKNGYAKREKERLEFDERQRERIRKWQSYK
jgi:hypothetical protein